MVQGPMRTILAGLLLCTAFAVADGHAQSRGEIKAEPTAEDIARGKALTEAGDCASCHTAAVRRGKTHRYAVRRHLRAQPDA